MAWRYSRKRLDEIDAALEQNEVEYRALADADQRTLETRTRGAANIADYDRLTLERDRCAMALWRRSRKS